MKITRLPNSKSLTNDWFKKEVDVFIKLIEERFVDFDKETSKNETKGKLKSRNEICSGCCLDFFYYRDNTYKNAIWIKVHNSNSVKIWIRVGIYNTGKKKVNVCSECDLDCIHLSFVEKYALPPDFDKNGIWMSDKRSRATNVTFDVVLQQICKLLPCLCQAKCK